MKNLTEIEKAILTLKDKIADGDDDGFNAAVQAMPMGIVTWGGHEIGRGEHDEILSDSEKEIIDSTFEIEFMKRRDAGVPAVNRSDFYGS